MTLSPDERGRWESYVPLTVPHVSEIMAASAWLIQTSSAILERLEVLTSTVVNGAAALAPERMNTAKDIAMHLLELWYPYAQRRGDQFLEIIANTKLGVSAMQVEREQFGI